MAVFRARAEDAATVAVLLDRFNAEFETWSPDVEVLSRRFAAMLARDDVLVLVAGEPQTALGFALVTLRPTPYYDGPLAVLDELYIDPARRGGGLGSELISVLLDELRARGCGEIHINVDEGDAGARRFYESHGFVNQEPGTNEQMLCYIQELQEP